MDIKKIWKTAFPILTGFLIAMILMAIMIYFGYTEAYALNIEALTVKMMGIPIYELVKAGAEYTGTALGPNMGIICAVFILLSFCVSGVISAIKKAYK